MTREEEDALTNVSAYDEITPKGRKPGKPADQGWLDYINQKLSPMLETMGAAGTGATRAAGPLNALLDPILDPVGGALQPLLGRPALTGDENRARRENREKEHPLATEVGRIGGSVARDTAAAMNPWTRGLLMANRANSMAIGGGIGAGGQLIDEYDRMAVRNEPLEPMADINRVVGATLGGAAGGMAGSYVGKRTPWARDLSGIKGPPLTPEELTGLGQAHGTAAAQGDTVPDLAQLMRLSANPELAKRAPDIEAMYRRAKPQVIDAGTVEAEGPRLAGRLSSPVKDGTATVVPEVLDQIRARKAPGGFTQRVDDLAGDLGHAETTLKRRYENQPVGRVDDIVPPSGSVSQGILNQKRKLYEQAVERERQPNPSRVDAARGGPGYIPEQQAKANVGPEHSLDFWNTTLSKLSPDERTAAEAALSSIQRASPPTGLTGKGPQGIGSAFEQRARAQQALDQHREVQRSIGESYPYAPGQSPKLTIAPPAFTGVPMKFGVELPGMGQGAASRGTTKSFTNPLEAGKDIGRMSQPELLSVLFGSELGRFLGKQLAEGVNQR